MTRSLIAFICVIALPGFPAEAFAQTTRPAGAYRVDADRFLIVRGTPPDGLSILDSHTGHVRNLTPTAEGAYTHGPTRSRTTPVSGRVEFDAAGRMTWTSELLGILAADRILSTHREVVVPARDGGRLHGELFLPAGRRPNTVAVIVPLGDRHSLWEPAMWLLASGIGVFVYDQRGSGASAGTLFGATSNSHTLETLQLADDAVTVVRQVRELTDVDPDRVGILGWSQGGWVGAMAASRLEELAFYVNVAANANPWPEQAEHRFLARLQREGFTGNALRQAKAYFTALRGVSEFRIEWQDYQRVRDLYRSESWYRTIIDIFPFFAYDDYGEALVGWSFETAPEVFFRRLSRVPSLGVYFEHDQSNPPDSPRRFRRALEEAGNPRVEVRTFSGLNHGAWVVDGHAFDPDAIERRDPVVFDFIARWIAGR